MIRLVKSHYVPQLILRHFGTDERIQYCDLDKKKVETRNIKSAFAEKGYYPDEIESDLCYKTEKDFAYLLNSKILKERYRITLSPEELFTLKKFLIVTSIRFNVTEAMKDYDNPQDMIDSYSKDFYSNINKVLACEKIEEMASFIEPKFEKMMEMIKNPTEAYGENKLFSDIKNILHSYVVFVSTNRCKEDFIIPDVGFSYRASHIALPPFSDGSFDKCMYTLSAAMQTGNPFLMRMASLMTPYDFILVPVSKDLAIVSLNVFYKFFNRNSDVYGMLPVNGLKVSELIGFGDNDMVEPPKVKNPYGNKAYEYSIKQIAKEDARIINISLLNTSEHHFGFSDIERIRGSLKQYNEMEFGNKRYNFDFMLE